jgi:hypothetical protein
MGMFYKIEELVVPAFANVAGSGITVDCSICVVVDNISPEINKHHGERYSSLVWCLSTTTTTTSDCSVV